MASIPQAVPLLIVPDKHLPGGWGEAICLHSFSSEKSFLIFWEETQRRQPMSFL